MKKGYTYLEVLIVIAIAGLLFGFIAFNLFKTQHETAVTSIVNTLLSDLKNQQTKAMIGVNGGRPTGDSYGIFFQSNSYVLFYGNAYNSQDSTNFNVPLDQNLTISTTLASNTLVFSQLSGEVFNFSPFQNTITIKNTAGLEQKIITVNRYGVVTGIN